MRMVVFTDEKTGRVPFLMMEALVKEISLREEAIQIAALCIRRRSAGKKKQRSHWVRLRRWIRGLFEEKKPPGDLVQLAAQHGIPILEAPDENINHPDLLETLCGMKATHGLSVYCLQKFGMPLLELFEGVVNYHNGLLPDYKGVKATSWSIYRGDPMSGFSFHWMSKGLDEGAVLVAGGVPVAETSDVLQVDTHKAIQAASRMKEVLDLMIRREPGTPQMPGGGYFSCRDADAIQNAGDPAQHSSTEIQRRIRAFGSVKLTVGGRQMTVSQVAVISPLDREKDDESAFCCQDGVRLKVLK